jgi:hypothetical protein
MPMKAPLSDPMSRNRSFLREREEVCADYVGGYHGE